ncbi:MAG: heme o synthase [Verrucomicrobiae bacterium]|nr:heme o synthase [Verrucomicrobiae bacterium]
MNSEIVISSPSRSRWWDAASLSTLAELTKARLNSLVLLTTAAGYYLGSEGALDAWGLARALGGTGLLAGGAAVLNQYLEREFDARMTRTAHRPLPAGRVKPETALLLGGLLSLAGLVYLAAEVNLLTAFLGAVTLITYLFIYTPLKRRTIWNTVVGAVPGALPPVMGWVAAQGRLDWGALAVFAILFFWQVPHFLAIAWLYRDDYARGGYVMLPVVDPQGARTARHALHYTVAMTTASIFPSLLGLTGGLYLAGALFLGALFLSATLWFARRMHRTSARALFLASILYHPVLVGLMVWDKI